MTQVGTTSIRRWIPEVEEGLKPIVEKTTFSSVDAAFNFYNHYAKKAGFSVRRGSNKYNKSQEEIWKMFVCSKEGTTDNKVQMKYGVVKRRRSITRESCKARMTIKKEGGGPNYIVKKFVEEHSHELATPRKKHLLRSHREVCNAQKNLENTFTQTGIGISQTMNVLAIESGGYENIGCIEQDVRNYERDKRKETKDHDAQLLYEHFSEMKELDPSFTYNVKVDVEGRLTHCFWADPISRKAYHHFGDVIVFDTTYNTNHYELIFAPFTGVNHHGQSIILGCGFIHNETTESFIWLFEKWCEAMLGDPPKAIITDQDPAMTKAIAIVFPNAFHRYCIWHILQKVPEKLGHIAFKDEFKVPFYDSIWNSEKPEDFEVKWSKVIEENELDHNDWLASLFNIRHKWVPAYLRHVFFAGMSSSQRSESTNAFFRKYVSKNNSLMDFIIRFDRGVARQRHNELVADHETISSKPKLKTLFAMERELGETYTRSIFYKFQEELYESTIYIAILLQKIEGLCIYNVGVCEGTSPERLVEFKMESKQAKCSCLKFEFEGIPCRHILCILRQSRIPNLPDHYILKRWTRDAKLDFVYEASSVELNTEKHESYALRYSNLLDISRNLAKESANFKETYHMCKEGLQDILKRVQDQKLVAGSGKRLISEREKVARKKDKRRCNGCGKWGPGHDKRNCPIWKKLIRSPACQEPSMNEVNMCEEPSDDEVDMHEEPSDDEVDLHEEPSDDEVDMHDETLDDEVETLGHDTPLS
ncbi:protein FAR1-RELATED SEQUENCE 5-like [Magnolia sinica]|uniref:protein FAR1-RELATED SEQUENCE 5-like n=1 Tax=Magnolia sinica TaxID=86752 RepID=UPI00265A0470|nr:protein FAR1-RELATED SEQUENCE 5-like [Magnolia sinica]